MLSAVRGGYDGSQISRTGYSYCRRCGDLDRPGRGAEARRDSESLSSRESAEPLYSRGGDILGQCPGDGAVQQSCHLRPAQAAEQHRHHSAGAGHQLGLEQGRDATDIRAAAGGQMARRLAVHGQGREMHFRPAAGQSAGQVPQEPAQGLVRERDGCHGQRRLRGDVPSHAAATVAACDARFRLYADLSLPRLRSANANASDRHRPL